MNDADIIQIRKAADRVWDLAREYESQGQWELAAAIKDLADQLHELARKKLEERD